MLQSMKDHDTAAAPASVSAIVDEQEAFTLSAPRDALQKLPPAARTHRPADLQSSNRAEASPKPSVRPW